MLYCLLTGELVLRAAAFVWAPVSPFVAHHRVHDERLGWRLNPAYPDVDAWSFRNTTVPAQADIVILGDSQTYGYGVAPHLAWPRQLTQLTGWTSYNIACSGYSPVHGLAIWEDVLSLRPRFVVAALYAGNDLYDTFDLVYGHDQLPHLRTPDRALERRIANLQATTPLVAAARALTRMGGQPSPLRDVLRDHSALFHFVRHLGSRSAALTGRQQNSWEAVRQRARRHPDYLSIYDGGVGARTTLTIAKRLLPLDRTDPRIDEGLRVTLRALGEMSRRAAASGAEFLVLWIPTKELVFAPQITDPSVGLRRLIKAETELQRLVEERSRDLDAHFVDALPALRHALETHEMPYPESADGHPTASGYASIAAVVAAALPAPGRAVHNDGGEL